MSDTLLGFGDALQPLNIAFIVLGVLLGYVIGVLPGLNRPAALAICGPAQLLHDATVSGCLPHRHREGQRCWWRHNGRS